MRQSSASETNEFYALFADAGANALGAARLVGQRLGDFPDTAVDQAEVKELEHEGDRLTADIFQLLNTRYSAPFDREDIYGLARAIDDVVDHIEHASDLLGLYKVEAPMEQALEQCRVLVGATENLAAALSELPELEEARRRLAAIKELEDEGDRIVRDAIAALFEDDGISLRVIIRWKDIFEALEEAIDACDAAAHVIGNIVVKSA